MERLARAFSSRLSPAGAAAAGVAAGGESVPYLRSMLRAPPKLKPVRVLWNSCSFIGTVVDPVKPVVWDEPGHNGAYTVLDVSSAPAAAKSMGSSSPFASFRLLLLMAGKLALIAFKHLKPDDFVYVRGSLGSYEKKITESGNLVNYKVFVEDLDFVTRNNSREYFKKVESSGGVPINHATGIFDYEKKLRDRLHLWQIFFASPHEWWDNRQRKLYPNAPDFKHKDTRECLWINHDDPPWVIKQLELYDSKKSLWEQTDGGRGRSKVRQWKIDEL